MNKEFNSFAFNKANVALRNRAIFEYAKDKQISYKCALRREEYILSNYKPYLKKLKELKDSHLKEKSSKCQINPMLKRSKTNDTIMKNKYESKIFKISSVSNVYGTNELKMKLVANENKDKRTSHDQQLGKENNIMKSYITNRDRSSNIYTTLKIMNEEHREIEMTKSKIQKIDVSKIKEQKIEKLFIFEKPNTEKVKTKVHKSEKAKIEKRKTEKTIAKEHKSEKTKIIEHKSEKTKIIEHKSEKTIIKEHNSEKSKIKELKIEKTKSNDPKSEKPVFKEPAVKKRKFEVETEWKTHKKQKIDKTNTEEQNIEKTLVEKKNTEKVKLEKYKIKKVQSDEQQKHKKNQDKQNKEKTRHKTHNTDRSISKKQKEDIKRNLSTEKYETMKESLKTSYRKCSKNHKSDVKHAENNKIMADQGCIAEGNETTMETTQTQIPRYCDELLFTIENRPETTKIQLNEKIQVDNEILAVSNADQNKKEEAFLNVLKKYSSSVQQTIVIDDDGDDDVIILEASGRNEEVDNFKDTSRLHCLNEFKSPVRDKLNDIRIRDVKEVINFLQTEADHSVKNVNQENINSRNNVKDNKSKYELPDTNMQTARQENTNFLTAAQQIKAPSLQQENTTKHISVTNQETYVPKRIEINLTLQKAMQIANDQHFSSQYNNSQTEKPSHIQHFHPKIIEYLIATAKKTTPQPDTNQQNMKVNINDSGKKEPNIINSCQSLDFNNIRNDNERKIENYDDAQLHCSTFQKVNETNISSNFISGKNNSLSERCYEFCHLKERGSESNKLVLAPKINETDKNNRPQPTNGTKILELKKNNTSVYTDLQQIYSTVFNQSSVTDYNSLQPKRHEVDPSLIRLLDVYLPAEKNQMTLNNKTEEQKDNSNVSMVEEKNKEILMYSSISKPEAKCVNIMSDKKKEISIDQANIEAKNELNREIYYDDMFIVSNMCGVVY